MGATPRENDHMHELIHARLLDEHSSEVDVLVEGKLSLAMCVSVCMYVLVQKQGSLVRRGG